MLVVLETIVIIALLLVMLFDKPNNPDYYRGFLSPSVYAGIMEPKSFTIFNFNPLRSYLQSYIENNSFDVSLYVENLRDESTFAINSNRGVFPASLNKIPVAVLIMNKIEKGELNYNTQLGINKTILNSNTDKIYFENDRLSVKFLLDRMLKESDNDAFYILLRNIDVNYLNNLMDYYNIDAANSFKYSGANLENNNRLTPRSFANMFLSLYFSTVLDAKDSEYILSTLANTTFDMNKPANLPDYVVVAHKYGIHTENDLNVFNDCGIIYINNDAKGRILYCITIRGQDTPTSVGITAYLVNNIYKYYLYKRLELDTFKQDIIAIKNQTLKQD